MDLGWFRVQAYLQYKLESGVIKLTTSISILVLRKNWSVGKLVIAHRTKAATMHLNFHPIV
jgi:hypothetical protein